MARSRQPQGYPRVYFELIESVSNTGKPFIFPRKDRKQAELMRFQLYSFIKACRASSNDRDNLIGKQAYGLVFSIRGNDLVISLRDNTNEAQELAAALNSYEATEAPAPSEMPVNPMSAGRAAAYFDPAKETPATTAADSHEDMINQFMNKDKGK